MPFLSLAMKKTLCSPKMNRTSIDDLMAGKLVCGRDLYEIVSTNWWFRYEWHHFRAIHQSHFTSENVYSVSNNTHYFHISAYHSTKRHTKSGKNYRFMQFYADADFYRIAKKCAENHYFSYCTHTVFSLCFTWLHKFPLELQHFYRCEDIFYPPHSNIIINNIAFHIVRISHQYSVLCFDHEATVSSWFQLLLPFTICAQCCNCTLFIFAICIILIVYTQKVSGVAITCTKISITNEHISYWFVILNEMPITCRQPFT